MVEMLNSPWSHLDASLLANPLLADLLGALVVFLLLLQLARTFVGQRAWQPVPASFPLALLALFPLLQAIPLPPAMVHWLSPRAWEFYRQSIWVVHPQAWMPLTVDFPSTLQVFFRGVTAWGLYLLVVQSLTDGQRLEKTVLVLSGAAALSALLALLFPLPEATLLLSAVLLPPTLALYLAGRPAVDYYSWRERLGQWLCSPQITRQMLLLGAILLLLTALLAGAPSWPGGWSVGLLAFALVLLTRRRLRRRGAVLAFAAVLLVLITMLPPWGNHPFGSAAAWQGAWQIVAAFPVAGAGSGAQMQLPAHYRSVLGDHDPLLFAGGVGIGIGGLLLASWAMALWLRSTWANWRKRRNVLAVCLYAGCLGGLLAALLHAAVPQLLVALLAGLGAATALHSSRLSTESAASMGKFKAGVAMVFLAVLLIGQLALPLVLLPDRLPASVRQHVPEFFSIDRQQRLIDEGLRQGNFRRALHHAAIALRLQPLDPSMQLQAAEIFDRLGEEEAADQLWQSAAAAHPESHRRFAQRLWQRGGSEAAKSYLRRTLVHSQRLTGEFLLLMEFWGLGHEEMITILPEEPLAQLAFGEFLASRAANTSAAGRFRRAVQLAASTGGGSPDIFERAGEFFFAQGLNPEALEVVQRGLQYFPARIPLRRMAGSLYEKMGISYRAIEEYRQCLVLDPNDQWSRQRLAILAGD
jgi:tetratricopeptide (TPR) repeat protein